MQNFRPVQIKHYKLEKVLGQGGMGTVYQAKDLKNGRSIAIKKTLIPKHFGANVEELVERFKREYFFLSDIDHPNVIKAYDFFEEKRQLFMALEFIPGISLENFILCYPKTLTPFEQLAIASQIARAIEVINIAGIIHRDVKPANIMLHQKTKQVKLLDLGIAKSCVEELKKLTQVGTTVGTPEYMSPEQIDGRIAINSDVFSLGIVLYQFFSWQQKSPFRRKNAISTMSAIATSELPPLNSTLDIPLTKVDHLMYQQLSDVLIKSLAKKPMQRWATSKELADQLFELYQMYGKLLKQRQAVDFWAPTGRTTTGEVEKLEELGKKYGQDLARKNRKVGKRRKPQKSSSFPFITVLVAVIAVLAIFLWPLAMQSEASSQPATTKQQKSIAKPQVNRSKPLAKKSSKRSFSKSIISKSLVNMGTKEYQQLQKDLEKQSLYQRWEILAQFIKKYPQIKNAKKAQKKIEWELNKGFKTMQIQLENISKDKDFTQLSKCRAFFENIAKNRSTLDKMSIQSREIAHSLDALFGLYDSLQLAYKNQQQQGLWEKWQKWEKKIPGLLTKRSCKLLQLSLEKLKELSHNFKDKKFSIFQALLADIEQILKIYKRLYSVFKKKKGKKISVSLVQGKYIRGTITKVALHKFALKDYRGRLFTIRFSQLQAREVAKFFPKLAKKASGLCSFGILYFCEKKLSMAQKHLQTAHKKGHFSALLWLKYVTKAQEQELAKIQRIEIYKPQNLSKEKKITVKSSDWQLPLLGKVKGGVAVKEIVCNGEAIHFGKEKREFKKNLALKYGKNKVELLVACVNGKKTRRKWTILRPKARNLSLHRGNLSRIGVYFTKPVSKFKRLKWRFRAGRSVHTSGVIHGNAIYFGNDNGYFFCLSLAGKQLWRFQGRGSIHTCSTAIEKGLSYFGTDQGHLYAVDIKTGKQVWHRRSFQKITASPLVANNMLYLGTFDKVFYALEPKTGKTIWSFKARAVIRGSAALVDNTLYFGALDKHMYALDAQSGQKKWERFVQREIYATPAVADKIIYIPAANGHLYALEAVSGKILWEFATNDGISSSPAVAEGIVYLGGIDRYLYAINAKTGKQIWRFKAGSFIRADVVVAEKVVYFTCGDAHIYALDNTGKLLWKYETDNEITRSAPIVSDGVVYFGSDDGFFYAIE